MLENTPKMDPRFENEVSITDLFDQFIEASTMRNVLSTFHQILNYADLSPCEYNIFFPKLKRAVMTTRVRKNWKAKALFSKIDKKAAHRCYSNTKVPTPIGTRPTANQFTDTQEHLDDNISSPSNRQFYSNNALRHHNCLIIGSGPAGLRTAIELQLLGASKVVVVEKRGRFSRNNVLHLWPFVIDDLKSLGAKKFYGKFCAGSIDHISIRQLQLILLKICLMIGCDFRENCSYFNLCPSSINLSEQQVKNGTNGDINKAHGSSDSITANASECDQEIGEISNTDDFIKISEVLNDQIIEDDKKQDTEESNHAANDLDQRLMPDKQDADDGSQSNHTDINQENQVTQQQPTVITRSLRGDNLIGCRAHFECDFKPQEKELHSYEWDIIIGADGRRNTLSKFFPRKEFRGRLAIAITANFINRQTPLEAYVPEISGLSFIYNQDMFNALAFDTNIQLENICYYKDDTHYFVMTAKKKSLLERGVLIKDYAVTQDLLADCNIDRQALLKYAKDAAYWTTGLEPLDFALNHHGQEDCAMFDFTSMYAASNACKALRTKGGGLTLLSLVGDSLLEPFWPTGSGCARGFLSSFDASWMCRQWAVNRCAIIDHHNPLSTSKSSNHSPNDMRRCLNSIEPTTYNRMALSVMAERESIYRILAQTTSENLQQNYSLWTLNPHSRYPNLNRHLVMPSQVEHLLSDASCKNQITAASSGKKSTSDRNRRLKSPNSSGGARKSPKKLKSANSSPLTQHKNFRSSSRMKYKPKSKSKHDIHLDATYLEFERSYNNLADSSEGSSRYLNYKRPGCDLYDDLFDPALSGTLPSSNNLLSLEARRARDIDDCLRQRRQKTQINVVRDQLINQMRQRSVSRDAAGDTAAYDKSNHIGTEGRGPALISELRRRRQLQSKDKENISSGMSSLTLLNSIRRCASFAERVRSFESKMGSASSSCTESAAVTPRSPESVKNLPYFDTLQELFVGKSKNDKITKTKMPIMKLSKDDWNVKCWEKRLAAHEQKVSGNYVGSSKSLNILGSDDNHTYSSNERKPDKQVAVFKDRIKEMAEKLETARSANHKLYADLKTNSSTGRIFRSQDTNVHLREGWVSHLKKELIKESQGKRYQANGKQAVNPVAPNRTIKKLFAEDDEDDGIDVNRHYDHLCVNRPTNKYLSKSSGYSSHLTRTKYDSATSRVINRNPPNAESKQAYLAALASRGSSASSTLSNYSTNTGGSNSTEASSNETCFRCNGTIDSSNEKISIGDANLHVKCLTCASCSLTLRTSEINFYLKLERKPSNIDAKDFYCSICQPITKSHSTEDGDICKEKNGRATKQSREDFLNERINYNELYKNILDKNIKPVSAYNSKVDNLLVSSSRIKSTASAQICSDLKTGHKIGRPSLSPVQVTLPMNLIRDRRENLSEQPRIPESEKNDESTRVTLVLPEENGESKIKDHKSWSYRPMIDEDELERYHHLDKQATKEARKGYDKSSSASTSSLHHVNKEEEAPSESSDENSPVSQRPDDASSLNSSLNTADYDDKPDTNTDGDSTSDDFSISEELGPLSDCEDNADGALSSDDKFEDVITEAARNVRSVPTD